MSTERVYYSDVNGIRIGNRELLFGSKRYSPRNVTGATVVTQRRRAWPGYLAMFIGAGLIGYAWVQNNFSLAIMGVGALLGGSFYVRRRRPLYALQLHTNKGPILVLASHNRAFLRDVKDAVDRALYAVNAPETPAGG